MSTATKTKKIVKTVAKVSEIAGDFTTIASLSAAIKMCPEKELKNLLKNLSPEQINIIVDYCTPIVQEIEALEAKIKDTKKSLLGLDTIMLQAMELKSQKSIVTPSGSIAEVAAGRTTSTFTTTTMEFIEIVKDAGHSDVLDEMVSIKKTAAEQYLGKALVNKITISDTPEWGKVKFTTLLK